jgi:hypothetical protein
MKKITRLIACALAACSVACGDDNPAAPTNLPGSPVTELFIGALPVGGSSFYSIGFAEPTQVRVTLMGLSSEAGAILPGTLTLRLGIPSGTGCTTLSSAPNVAPGFAAQVVLQLDGGTYCVAVDDTGGLTQTTNFLVRIHQIPNSALSPDPPAPSTETFASNLAVRGTSARTFRATASGTLTVTLQSIGPPSTVNVDVSLGIPRSDGTGCLVSRTQRGGALLQMSTPVDAGSYCVVLTDFGDLTAPVSFTVSIAKP